MGLFSVKDTGHGTEIGGGAELLTDDTVICELSGPTLETCRKQLMLVRNYTDLRIDRNAEILVQIDDILSFFGAVARLNTRDREATLELLAAVQSVAVLLTQQIKHFCWVPRPIELAPQVQPVIQTPDHSSFPSGHATEAFAVATVLTRLMRGEDASIAIKGWRMPFRLAHRIAVNRTVAGVHYPVDSAGGAILGCLIGEAIVAAGGPSGDAKCPVSIRTGSFDAADFAPEGDFTPRWLQRNADFASDGAMREVPLVRACWARARAEWPSEADVRK